LWLCQHSDVSHSSHPLLLDTDVLPVHSAASPPWTSRSLQTLPVPPSIPENGEVTSVSGEHGRRATSTTLGVGSRRTSDTEATTRSAAESTRRRGSVPAAITSDAERLKTAMNVAKTRHDTRLRVDDILSNFPTVHDPHSPPSFPYTLQYISHVVVHSNLVSSGLDKKDY